MRGLLYICFMRLPAILFIFIVLYSCQSDTRYSHATDAQDAGREFIRASLDGDMQKATFYLLRDSSNDYVFNMWRQQYQQLSAEEKRAYREAQIRPVRIEPVNDSVVNYIYTNSYKQDDTTFIKIVRYGDYWQVDLKDIH